MKEKQLEQMKRCKGAESEIQMIVEKYKVRILGIVTAVSGDEQEYTSTIIDNVPTTNETALHLGQLNHSVNKKLYD